MCGRRSIVVLLSLAFATSSCATASRDELDPEPLLWDAARECKSRFPTIKSIDQIDPRGRLQFRYEGPGSENVAFQQRYREGVEQRVRAALDLPPERVTRDPNSPPRVTVSAEPTGSLTLIAVRLNGTTDARMIVDTGASMTILSPAIVSKLGLEIPRNARRSTANVAGGHQIRMPRIRLASAKVGSVAVENLYVGVYDVFPNAPQVQGLLGFDFLKHFRVSFEKGGTRLVLDTPE